jgi:hypothetical protein
MSGPYGQTQCDTCEQFEAICEECGVCFVCCGVEEHKE